MIRQYHLFTPTPARPPLVVAYGLGVDSTAMLIGLAQRGIRPDLVLFADCGGEKPQTYLYAPIFRQWLRDVDFPQFEVVRYPARTEAHFRRLFSVIREYLDALDAGRFNFRPGFHCGMCDFQTQCRDWAG